LSVVTNSEFKLRRAAKQETKRKRVLYSKIKRLNEHRDNRLRAYTSYSYSFYADTIGKIGLLENNQLKESKKKLYAL
jgi:hypothetical protein